MSFQETDDINDNIHPIVARYESRELLCAAADRTAESVSDPILRQSVFLYYLARYLVSVYEARFLELPIQVWNEYRNALDHFMRHVTVTTPSPDTGAGAHHLQRMEGHIQRAVLDVTKILCVQSHDCIMKEVNLWGDAALELIDGGNFRAEIRVALTEATCILEEAKINDANLGHDAWVNRAVIERFIDSFFKFDSILTSFNAKQLTLANAKRQIDELRARTTEARDLAIEQAKAEIRPDAMRRAAYVCIITGIPLTIIGAIFGWWLGMHYPATTASQPQQTIPVAQTTPQTSTAPVAPVPPPQAVPIIPKP